jgi:3-deoxy-D-manno-octulosonate 8-phosphate phosphatase (KDO 8-P phosphatase)
MEFFGIPTSNTDTNQPFKIALSSITLILLSVDGVLTDGQITYTESGDEIRNFFARDGFAIKEALKQGLKIVVISERDSRAVKRRLIELGVTDIYMGIRNKAETYEELKTMYQVDDKNCLYVGDDVADIPILEQVGFSCTPLNGVDYLRNHVTYVSAYEGGKGCVRDIIETVLMEQGKWKFYP